MYVVARKGDLNSTGSLISANVLQLNADEIRNGGTIAGRKVVDLRAQNIEHSGQIRGEKVWVEAQNQINLQGGDIAAGKLLSLTADQINASSTTATSGDKQNGNTVVDRVARLSVGEDGSEGGILSIQSKHDTHLNGAVVRNTSQGGKTQIVSEHGNVDLGTVATERHESYGRLSDKNHRHVHQTAEVGTDIQSQGDLLVKAGNDIKIRQGNLDSEKGLTALQAGHNIQISEGRSTLDFDESVYTQSKGVLSKRSSLDTYQRQHDEAQGSSVTGKTVYMNGDNIRAVGSSIVSDELTVLDARKDIDVQAATSRYHDIETSERKKSGFAVSVSHAKLNVGYNKSRSNVGHDADLQVAEAAQIGSLKGHTVLTAGNHVQVTGSNLLAGKDIDIQAKTVDIDAASLLQQENLTQSSKSSGFNVGINLKPGEVRQFSRYWDGIKATRKRQGTVRDKAHTWEKNHLAGALEPLTPSSGLSITRNTSSHSINETRTEATGSKVQAGGVVRINATDGDINIKGSNVFGKGGLQLQAANGEIHNLAAQEKSDVESSGFNRTSGLMSGGSIASRFIGSKTETTHENNSSIQEVASTIGDGSPLGSVFEAQGYTQIGSNLLSGGHVDIYAKNIQIKAGEATQRNDHHYTFTQKGITVGVNAPIVQAIDSAQSAVRSLEQAEQSGKQRTQAMAVANAGMQAYQASQAINKMGSGSKGGSKGGSNGVSISVTYGEQRNQSHSEIQDQQANASRILAEGQVRLHATGSGKDSNIKIEGSDVIGKQGTFLFADNQIDLLAAEQHHSEHHRNKNEGWNAGVAVSADKGASLGFTAGGNLGKGHADGEQTTYRHSHVGSAGSPTVIVSGGDTNIKGAQVTGKGITVRAANLNIESLQDTADYRSRQQNISAQVTVGYGASASGDYSQSKINAEHRSVSEQSGLFAGEDGFDVQVGGHTQLTGGIITSVQSAEAQGKNRFQSGTISQTDLHNISKYDGSSIGFGASVALSGETLGQGAQNNSKLTTVADKNSPGFNGVGYGRDSDHQESTTKSGIGTRNIILTDEAGQLAKTGYGTDKAAQLAYTDIHTEDASQHSGSLKNRFDADKVQNELDLQRTVSQEFSQTSQQVNKAINQKIDAINSELEKGNLSDAEKTKLETQRDNWQYSKVLLNMVASGLSAPTQNGVGIAAATAAPAVSYEIGQYFKAQKQEGSLKHIVAHAILGAAVSAAGDNNALAGALSAGGSEAAAPLISQWLYQESDGSKLTAEQKDTVNAITSALGAATGAVVGGTATDVAQGSLNAGNAVENNSQLFSDARNWVKGKANKGAKSAREVFPNTPAVSGIILGVGDVADGALGLTDATAESLAWVIHCPLRTSYCDTATENNQERGRVFADVLKSVHDGRMKSSLERWKHNLWNGTPEQRREATEQLARASTALGVGSATVSPKVNPLNRPISQVGRLFRARNVPSTKAGAGVSLANPAGAGKAVGSAAAKAGQQLANLAAKPNVPAGAARAVQQVAKVKKEADTFSKMRAIHSARAAQNDAINVRAAGSVVARQAAKRGAAAQAAKKAPSITSIPNKVFDHIIDGVARGKNNVDGGHLRYSTNVRVDKVIKKYPNGVYEAEVSIYNKKSGTYIKKYVKNGPNGEKRNHTMFPDSWTPDRAKLEIDSAWQNRKPSVNFPNNGWEGISQSGVRIEGFIDGGTGQMKNAYPSSNQRGIP